MPEGDVMDGTLTFDGLETAAKVFCAHDGEMSPMLIARDVPLITWRDDETLNCRQFHVVFGATFDGDPRNSATLAAIFIVRRTPSGPHQMALGYTMMDLGIQKINFGDAFYIGPCKDLTLDGEVRLPDMAIFQRIRGWKSLQDPCVVLELDHKNRPFSVLEEWIKGFISLKTRTAIAIKLFEYPHSEVGHFGAVALKYVRGKVGAPQLQLAASFGTVPLSSDIVSGMSDEVRDAMQHFEDGVAHEVALGHARWAHPTLAPPRIELTVDDLWYQDEDHLLGAAPPNLTSLFIDLYTVAMRAYFAMT
ncbi:hypothetical protein SDRG_07791 [Saprolegnia diclina VS20]|uniref:Uncharacterized protein n=1 Tax=Saprolegnia diclina (strain VS20) TaxID=1156394 RepID=T0QIC1_SAPDV|nr:hypothetical protein SDRG_07791 [Saprolegnia diclina VS20]EQC34461.1 hypothetical protein SDRG_07791 [Saprolegnia diclina VS20]|eukprot:XP_008611867.1 hypothetical protein SDRG_07791 [Saprolegnia diclina VS20]